jgi:tRNA(Ile)-lysidine synthase
MNKERSEKDLLLRVAAFCEQNSLFAPGDRVVLGVSGGPDSVTLLSVMSELSSKWNLSLFVAHLHHQLRGVEADTDQILVQKLSEQFGLPCYIESCAVQELAEKRRGGLEEAGRYARYQLFLRAKERFQAQKIALGHTASDRVETFLARLMRGSGSAISGLNARRQDGVVRPLLGVWREELSSYLKEHNLPFREDTSNLDTRFERNRIRHQLLPLIREQFNPRIESALLRSVELFSADEDYLNKEVERIVSELRWEESDYTIDIAVLSTLHPAILSRVIRRVSAELSPGYPPSAERVLGLMRFIYSGGSGRWWLLPELYALLSSGRCRFVAQNPVSERSDSCFQGDTEAQENTFLIQVSVLSREEYLATRDEINGSEMTLDAQKVTGQLRARFPQRGDRMHPSGLPGSKLLSDLFTDLKIPVWERRRAIIIEDDAGILGVWGLRLDERAAADENTRKYLVVSLLE